MIFAARFVLIVCLALYFSSAPTYAADVSGLFAARVPVADRSAPELKRGAAEALREVVVKLTGSRGRRHSAETDSLSAQASDLMLQYAYERQPEGDGLLLFAQFDEVALASRMEALGVPSWGKERPLSTVWLIIDDGETRQLSSSDEPGLFGDALKSSADRRAIPVLLPLMDIEEARHLIPAGDWQSIHTTAAALSSRYATPASLIGHLRMTAPGLWEAQWRLELGNEPRQWRDEGDIPEALVEAATDTLADVLAARYADPSMLAQAQTLILRVVGVNGAADYARLNAYLENLDPVTELFVRQVAADQIEFLLTARGGSAALVQTFALGSVLEAAPDTPGAFRLVQ